jgi:hypothetical protein
MLKKGGRMLMFRPSHSPTADPAGFQRIATLPLIELPQSFICIYERLFHVEQ